MPANREISKKFGVFRTVCCDAEIVIGVGVPFPDCPKHPNLTTGWKELRGLDPSSYTPNSRKAGDARKRE